jgi:hypothetical protein
MRHALVFLLVTGCGSDAVDTDVEQFVTIQQGVYGQTTVYDEETGKVKTESIELLVLREETRVRELASDSRGFYEAQLDPGDYRICTFLRVCTDLRVEAGKRVRKDHERGPARGWR